MIEYNTMQELFAKLALHCGANLKELQHPELNKIGKTQTDLLRAIKNSFIYFCKENQVYEHLILKIIDHQPSSNLTTVLKTFKNQIHFNPDYKYWYSQIKRFYFLINARKYNEIDNINIYDYDKITNIQQRLY